MSPRRTAAAFRRGGRCDRHSGRTRRRRRGRPDRPINAVNLTANLTFRARSALLDRAGSGYTSMSLWSMYWGLVAASGPRGDVIACAALLVSCAGAIHNEPINLPLDRRSKPVEPNSAPASTGELRRYRHCAVVFRRRHAGGGVFLRRAHGLRADAAAEPERARSRCSTASTSSPASRAARCWRPITA